jgi:sulfate permease, SulP family
MHFRASEWRFRLGDSHRRFFANAKRFADQVRVLVECAPTPVRWFVVDAGAITAIDYSAAQSVRDLIDELKRRSVRFVFARVSP